MFNQELHQQPRSTLLLLATTSSTHQLQTHDEATTNPATLAALTQTPHAAAASISVLIQQHQLQNSHFAHFPTFKFGNKRSEAMLNEQPLCAHNPSTQRQWLQLLSGEFSAVSLCSTGCCCLSVALRTG